MELISSNIEHEPADEPMAGRSSSAILAEVSGGLAEGVIRSISLSETEKRT